LWYINDNAYWMVNIDGWLVIFIYSIYFINIISNYYGCLCWIARLFDTMIALVFYYLSHHEITKGLVDLYLHDVLKRSVSLLHVGENTRKKLRKSARHKARTRSKSRQVRIIKRPSKNIKNSDSRQCFDYSQNHNIIYSHR